jgi:hypothetical protein
VSGKDLSGSGFVVQRDGDHALVFVSNSTLRSPNPPRNRKGRRGNSLALVDLLLRVTLYRTKFHASTSTTGSTHRSKTAS